MTPDQIAARLLSHLTPSTGVSVASPVFVAGRGTYELVLAPAGGTSGAAASTVSRITIAVDATTGMPLRIQVDAKGQSGPALQIGFTSVSFATPSASEFAPLSGTKVQTRTIGASKGGGSRMAGFDAPAISGTGWDAVATFGHVKLGNVGNHLSEATTSVSGSFGTARLLQTTLLNALIFPDGRVVAGFVTPSALEAAAASGSH